jgi:hypothetical protein
LAIACEPTLAAGVAQPGCWAGQQRRAHDRRDQGEQTSSDQAGCDGFDGPISPPSGGSGLGQRCVVLPGRTDVFKWLLFFVLVLAGILAFVTWVMGIPIPGFSGFQQNPFNQ